MGSTVMFLVLAVDSLSGHVDNDVFPLATEHSRLLHFTPRTPTRQNPPLKKC